MRTRQPRASVQSQRRLASGRVARELGGRGGQGAYGGLTEEEINKNKREKRALKKAAA